MQTTTVEDLIASSISLANHGKIDDALESIEYLIKEHPENLSAQRAYVDVLFIALGSKLDSVKSQVISDRALSFFSKILLLNPRDAKLWNRLGLCMQSLGKINLAIVCFDKAINRDICLIQAYENKALCFCILQDLPRALAILNEALGIDPSNEKILFRKGGILFDLKMYNDALESFRVVHQKNPDDIKNCKFMAYSHFYLQDFGSCLALLQPISLKDALDETGLIIMGLCLENLKRFDEAILIFTLAIKKNPSLHEPYFHRGNSYFAGYDQERMNILWNNGILDSPKDLYFSKDEDLHRCHKALQDFKRAHAINPNNLDAIFNIGACLFKMHQQEEAIVFFDKIISINPLSQIAYRGKSACLGELNRYEEAIPFYEKAIELDPNDFEVKWNYSTALLAIGDYRKGWDLYESRFHVNHLGIDIRNFPQERLQNLQVQGKTIFICHEQGLGDTIQFCRYAKLLKDLGARVILEVQKPLVDLIKTLDPEIEVIPEGKTPSYFDFHIHLISLVRLFKTELHSVPYPSAYLSTPSSAKIAWQGRLTRSSRLKVGIVFAGNPKHVKDALRSVSFEEGQSLLHLPIDFHLLQKEIRPCDVKNLHGFKNLKMYMGEIKDFSDTAAIIEQMDLVISVDTSTAHLAGALGKEVWILLGFNMDYRWLKQGELTPWYSCAKLFRQEKPGSWEGVMKRVEELLLKRCKESD